MTQCSYRVGIVGCGGMGRLHAETYRANDRTSVVATAEPDGSTRSEFAAEFDVSETFEEHRAMFEEVDLDVVSVCTWPSTHARITVDAARAGVDGIYCEKPMATNVGEARDMIDAAERNDVVLTVGHQRRYDPVHEKARELVAGGAIGTPAVARASYRDGLFNWGSHLIDLVRYFLDDPETEWVMGQFERKTDRYERGEPIEDRCMGQICFEDGARLTIEMDLPEPDATDNRIQVYGDAGSLDVCLESHVTVRNEDGQTKYAPGSDASNWGAYLEDMLEAMENEDHDHRSHGRQAEKTVEICMSIYESARTNGLVRTPLRTRANPLEVMLENGDLPPEHPGAYDIRIPYRSIDE